MEFIDPATLSNQKPQRSLCLHFPLAGIAGLYHRTWLYCMGSELGSSNLSSKHLATCAPPGLHISLGPHKCRAFEEFESFSVRSPHGCSTSRRLGKAEATSQGQEAVCVPVPRPTLQSLLQQPHPGKGPAAVGQTAF